MPSRSSAFSSTLRPLYVTPRWSRICTTCPEKPHCGNCGVPFMNSTTSLDFTSLSINCSMLIFASSWGSAPLQMAFRAGVSRSCPLLPYMYPKPLCIQSKMARSWHAGDYSHPDIPAAVPGPGHSWRPQCHRRGEAFFPAGSPYLGQTVLGEPVGQSNVLSPTGDTSDETSIRCGHSGRPCPSLFSESGSLAQD